MLKDSIRESISAEVARILSEERQRKGISMNGLAALSGLSQSFVSTFESNPHNPTFDSLLRLSSALDLNLGDVIRKAIAAKANSKAASRPEC